MAAVLRRLDLSGDHRPRRGPPPHRPARRSPGIALREVDRFKEGAGRSEEATVVLEEAAQVFRETGDEYGERLALAELAAPEEG